MSKPLVHIEREGSIGRIVFDRPEVLNPICLETISQCRTALASFRDSGDIRVVVLTGAGRAFSAGADLKMLGDMMLQHDVEGRRSAMNEVMKGGHGLIRELRAFPGTVVSLVNGPVVGGGVGIALAADIVLAAKSAYFSFPFVPKLGLVPDLGGLSFMQKRVGAARAMACALLGEPVRADTAAEWGLIWRSVADDRYAEAAADLLERLAALPVTAVAALREMSARVSGQPFDDWLDKEREWQARLFAAPEAAEGLAAFLERRAPEFHTA